MLYLFTCIILYCDFFPLWYCGQNIESDRICSLSLIFSVLIFCIHISYNIAIFRVKATYLTLLKRGSCTGRGYTCQIGHFFSCIFSIVLNSYLDSIKHLYRFLSDSYAIHFMLPKRTLRIFQAF